MARAGVLLQSGPTVRLRERGERERERRECSAMAHDGRD